MNPAAAAAVKAFEPSAEEKRIREEFSQRYQELAGAEPAATPAPQGDALPFHDPSQQVVLLNIAHRQQIPRSKLPAFRICGGFESLDKLKRHVLSTGGPDAYGGANLIKADIHKKFLLCSTLDKQQNAEYVLEKIEALTQKYLQTLQFHTQEFNENKERRQQGKTGLSQLERPKKFTSRKQLLDKKFEEESEKGQESGEVGRNAEVRNQNVAVVSIMDDTTQGVLSGTDDPEPIVIVWGCFENEEQAKHYIYHTASKHVKDVMLDVVNMYEWIFPTELSKRVDELTEEYRNPSLNKVMNARKTQKKSVLSYSEWCQKEGQEPASLEISATKASPEATEVTTEVKKTEDFKISVALKPDGPAAEALPSSAPAPTESWQEVAQVNPPASSAADLYKEVTFKPPTLNPNPPPATDAPAPATDVTAPVTDTPAPATDVPAKKPRGRPRKKAL